MYSSSKTQKYSNYNIIITPIFVQTCQSGQRLDQVLAALLPSYSRSQMKSWILNKKVIVNNQISMLPKRKMLVGDVIEIKDIEQSVIYYHNYNTVVPQNISLDIIYEDDTIVVINKPINMVVHPGYGNYNNTILNALLYRYPSSINISERAGLVHRLDKDTTGLMIIAKTNIAYMNLRELFKTRQVFKQYDAIVFGKFDHANGMINQPIRRHTIKRTCMTIHSLGKPAITHYSVIEIFDMYSRIRICTETGRTHQIRVHMAHIKHPIVGDQKYGGKSSFVNTKTSGKLNNYLHSFSRQALHASTLQLLHPVSKVMMKWSIPLPDDIVELIKVLRENKLS